MPDGSLDTTFGGDGKVTTWFPNAIFGFAQAIAIQADGKILAAGTMSGRHDGGAFARYLSNGHLDHVWGQGREGAAAVQSAFRCLQCRRHPTDGKIVAAGESSRHNNYVGSFAVVRLNVNGKLDKSFNADGRRLIEFSDENLPDRAIGVVVQPDGKIVLGGSAGDPSLFGHCQRAAGYGCRSARASRT
jgi:uncharacterized delta-60 repeat protein